MESGQGRLPKRRCTSSGEEGVRPDTSWVETKGFNTGEDLRRRRFLWRVCIVCLLLVGVGPRDGSWTEKRCREGYTGPGPQGATSGEPYRRDSLFQRGNGCLLHSLTGTGSPTRHDPKFEPLLPWVLRTVKEGSWTHEVFTLLTHSLTFQLVRTTSRRHRGSR